MERKWTQIWVSLSLERLGDPSLSEPPPPFPYLHHGSLTPVGTLAQTPPLPTDSMPPVPPSKSEGAMQSGTARGTQSPHGGGKGCGNAPSELAKLPCPASRPGDTSSHHPCRSQGSSPCCTPLGVGAHSPPSRWLATATLSGAGTCMLPLRSPHPFHASSASLTGEGSLEPAFVPSDCLTLSPVAPSLSSWGVAVEENSPGVFRPFGPGQQAV